MSDVRVGVWFGHINYLFCDRVKIAVACLYFFKPIYH